MKVINFGSLNIDYVYRVDDFIRPGETKRVKSREVFCGGKGLNQSIACAKAGLETYHAGLIGKDGTFLAEKLRECGVNTGYIKEVDSISGHTVIQVSDQGENCILLYPGTNEMLSDSFIEEALSDFSEKDVVILQNETNMVSEIIDKTSSKGMRIAFNAAPFTKSIKSYPIEKVKWLFVNEIEGAALSGRNEYEDIAVTLRKKYSQTEIILTIGAEGSIYAGSEGLIKVPAKKVVPVDTTAAGDAFTGFYIMGVLKGYGAKQALEVATEASAITVTCPGAADSIPKLNMLRKAYPYL